MACCDSWDELDPDLRVRALDLAWSTLRTLSGGQVGNCAVVMRPCLGPPCDWCLTNWWQPTIVNGQWVNQPCGKPPCWCERLCEIVFPGPVATIDTVTVDGAVLPGEAYRLDNGHRLTRVDGECWPSCQHVDLPPTEVGTMVITYVPGLVPGPAGLWAAGVLACEFAKACTGAKCRLPSSITSIARQGVAYEFSDGMFPNNQTGTREVDAYVHSINPRGHSRPSLVWSPDVSWARHRYQPAPAPAQSIDLAWSQGQALVRTIVLSAVVSRGWEGDYTAPIKDRSGILYGEFDVTEQVVGDDIRLTLTLSSATSAGIPAGSYTFDLIQDGTTVRVRGTATVGALVTV